MTGALDPIVNHYLHTVGYEISLSTLRCPAEAGPIAGTSPDKLTEAIGRDYRERVNQQRGRHCRADLALAGQTSFQKHNFLQMINDNATQSVHLQRNMFLLFHFGIDIFTVFNIFRVVYNVFSTDSGMRGYT
jgi:hypothetical protein